VGFRVLFGWVLSVFIWRCHATKVSVDERKSEFWENGDAPQGRERGWKDLFLVRLRVGAWLQWRGGATVAAEVSNQHQDWNIAAKVA